MLQPNQNAYTILAELYDGLSEHDTAAWSRYLQDLLMQHGVTPGMSVVDAACGTGDISITLAQRGYHVTGVDHSQQMLMQAAHKAIEAGVGIPFIHQDIRALRVHRGTRAIICACDGVNYLQGESDFTDFARSCFEGLPSGGVLLFDISSPARLRAMDGEFYGEEYDDMAYLWSNVYDEATQSLCMDITFFIREEGSELFRRENELHVQHVWEQAHLEELLGVCGFSSMVYNAFTLDVSDTSSERLQFVAIRK